MEFNFFLHYYSHRFFFYELSLILLIFLTSIIIYYMQLMIKKNVKKVEKNQFKIQANGRFFINYKHNLRLQSVGNYIDRPIQSCISVANHLLPQVRLGMQEILNYKMLSRWTRLLHRYNRLYMHSFFFYDLSLIFANLFICK